MTNTQYQNLAPRESANAPAPRLFRFERLRSGAATRFYPGGGARLHFANRDTDTLEASVPGGFLAAGDIVKVWYKGVCVFKGEVDRIADYRRRGGDATQSVVCVGPWSKMARCVYRQYWATGGGYSLSSRLILNQHQGGGAQNLDSELREIAGRYASACGYSVDPADISVSGQYLPFDECRDITVADAIKRELRFFPKAVCSFDYSVDPPALRIAKTATPATAAYVAAIPKTEREYVRTAHPVTGVDLEIESSGTIDGVEYHEIGHQSAGDTAAGNPDCLCATLQIKGAGASAIRRSFKSITEAIPQNLNDVQWWKARHPRLANVAAAAITITDGARTGTLPRISAASAGEILEAGLSCETSQFTCKATIATTDDREENVLLTMNFLTTNATGTRQEPKTYTWVEESSSESGETVPAGLAATILAERCGALLSERMTVRLGDALPSLGDAIVEPDGTVYLQSFDVDCADLTATLNFGIPEHLSPEDMASLLSGFRNKRTSSSATFRETGKTSDAGDDIAMGAIPPLSSSEFAPGTKAKTTFKTAASSGSSGSTASSGSVVIDTTGGKTMIAMGNGQKSVALDIDDLTLPDQPAASFKTLKVNGEDVAKILSSGAVDISLRSDNVSIARNRKNPAELEIAHFADGTKDSTLGLADRLTADPDTGKISQSGTDDGLMLVARKNGEVIYIPMSGGGEDPEASGAGGDDECAHPGSDPSGGVDPARDGGSSGAGGGSSGAGGGVAADGEAHTGDNGCNC